MPLPIIPIALGGAALLMLMNQKKSSTAPPPPPTPLTGDAADIYARVVSDPALRTNKIALAQYATTLENLGRKDLAAQLVQMAVTVDKEEQARNLYALAMGTGIKTSREALLQYAAKIDTFNIRPDLAARLREEAAKL